MNTESLISNTRESSQRCLPHSELSSLRASSFSPSYPYKAKVYKHFQPTEYFSCVQTKQTQIFLGMITWLPQIFCVVGSSPLDSGNQSIFLHFMKMILVRICKTESSDFMLWKVLLIRHQIFGPSLSCNKKPFRSMGLWIHTPVLSTVPVQWEGHGPEKELG